MDYTQAMIEMLEGKLNAYYEQIIETAMKQDKLVSIDPEEIEGDANKTEEVKAWTLFLKMEMKALLILKCNVEGMLTFLKNDKENKQEKAE